MPNQSLKEYLDNHGVNYVSLTHAPEYTAQHTAAAAHISGKQLAKTVIISADHHMAMVVLPADDHVNFSKLQAITGAPHINLATEAEFKDTFKDCELGAMPPFGNLYNMPVYLASSLTKQEHVFFNAGSHMELIEMSLDDYERLVKPKVVAI